MRRGVARINPGAILPKARRKSVHTADDQFQDKPELKIAIKPVINALAILRYLSDGNASTATKIARDLGINTSTCFNILRTLSSEEVIVFDRTSKTYKIGPGILQLASSVMTEDTRLAAARPILQDFARDHQVTVCMWRRVSRLRNVLVATEYAEGAVRIHLSLGQSLPVMLGSTGRAMAFHLGLSKRELRAEFNKLRWYSAPKFDDFMKDAEAAYARGWAIDDANFSPGLVTMSSPIISSSGNIGYSLTALMFKGHLDAAGLRSIGEELSSVAKELAGLLY